VGRETTTQSITTHFTLYLAVAWQHVFALEGRDELMKHVHDAAANNVGVSIRQRKDPITFDQYQLNRLGKYRQDTAIATASVYTHTRTTVKWPIVWDYLGELIRQPSDQAKQLDVILLVGCYRPHPSLPL